MRRWMWVALGGVSLSGIAWADEGPSVFVSLLEPVPPVSRLQTTEVREAVEQAIGEAYPVVSIYDVRRFPDLDVSTYIRSCPEGQRLGCAWVVGQRAGVDWVISGQVELADGDLDVELIWLRVDGGRPMGSLQNIVDRYAVDDLAWDAAAYHTWVVHTATDPVDLREGVEDPREAFERRREERAQWARELEDMGMDLTRRGPTIGEAGGRQGILTLSLLGSGGYGPFHARYDSRTARNHRDELVEVDSHSMVAAGLSPGLVFELGYGFLPSLEVALHLGARHSVDRIALYEEDMEGDGATSEQRAGGMTGQAGLRTTWMLEAPSERLRPLVHVGVVHWRANPVDELVEPGDDEPELLPPAVGVLQLGGGVEWAASERLWLHLRGQATLAAVGRTHVHDEWGVNLMEPRADDPRPSPFGLEVVAGATVPIRLGR